MSKSSNVEDPNKTTNPTDDVSQPNASCSAACTITSETVKEKPINRARTRIGAGELVMLTVSPESATWTATPNSLIKFIGDANKASNSITIQALDKAGDVTITAKSGTCECSIMLTIVLPAEIRMRRLPGSSIFHIKGLPSCGFFGQAYILPNDVNFYNVSIRELDDQFTATGPFTFVNGVYHGHYPPPNNASDWVRLDLYEEGVGSFISQGYDSVSGAGEANSPNTINTNPPPPFHSGEISTPIRWQWTINRFISGMEHNFPEIQQRAISDGDGTCTISKGGVTVTSRVNDKTSGFNPTTHQLDPNF